MACKRSGVQSPYPPFGYNDKLIRDLSLLLTFGRAAIPDGVLVQFCAQSRGKVAPYAAFTIKKVPKYCVGKTGRAFTKIDGRELSLGRNASEVIRHSLTRRNLLNPT